MGIKKKIRNWKELLHRYQYIALVLVAGILLMMLPAKENSKQIESDPEPRTSTKSLDEELSELLSLIDGAGEVQVLLTTAAGEEIIYQTDEDQTTNSDSANIKSKTIIITTADKSQAGLIRQVISPIYLGAIVLCQGADRPSVRLAMIEAVSRITGLGANNISVLKMK